MHFKSESGEYNTDMLLYIKICINFWKYIQTLYDSNLKLLITLIILFK